MSRCLKSALPGILLLIFGTAIGQQATWKSDWEKLSRAAKGENCELLEEEGLALQARIPEAEWEIQAELAFELSVCASRRLDDSSAFKLLYLTDSLYSLHHAGKGEVYGQSQAALGKLIYLRGDDPSAARSHLENALNACLKMHRPDSAQMSMVLEYLGKNASRLSEYMLAREMFGQCREIRRLYYGETSIQVALMDMYLGNTWYKMDLLPEALTAYQSSLAAIRVVEPDRSSTIATLLNNIAAVQDQLGQYQPAIDNYLEALWLTRKRYGDGHPTTILAFGNIGLVYHNMGNKEQAMKYMAKSAGMAGKMMDHHDPRYGQVMGDFAYVQSENGNHQRGLELLQSALHAYAPSSIAEDWQSNPDIADVLHHDLFRNAITYKAAILTRMADSADRPEPYLRLALDCYDLFSASLDQVWLEFSDPGDKLYLNRKGVNEYEKAICCAARLWEETGEESWKAKVFEFMERGKCQVMLESIRRSRASYLAEIPQDVRDRGIQLREEVNELFYRQSVGHADSGKTIRSALIQKRLDLDRFSDSLELVYPGYAEMTGQKKIVPMAMIQDRFTGNSTCVMEYFLGDSSLYVIAMSPLGSTFRETALPVGFEDSLRHFLRLMQKPDPMTKNLLSYRRLGLKLYELLLEPELEELPAEVNRLRIIPDGLLGLLPFDALPQGPGPDHLRHHGDLPMLIFNYRVSYANSAALLAGAAGQNEEAVECLGFAWNDQSAETQPGPSRMIKGLDWPPLPGAGRELAQIRGMVKGAFFTGDEASESKFKALAGNYGLLHLALHGNSGDEEPFIVFPSPGDSLEDGVLNLYELYNLPLKARLAVLSACETGSGTLQRGEGIMSIASGFGSAGCPAVLMSVWPVDDQAGSHIMKKFYEGLAAGLPVDEALHAAKLAYMKSGGSYQTAPYYWAPFVVLGDVEEIHLSPAGSSNFWWWIGGGILLLLLAIGAWRVKRKMRK